MATLTRPLRTERGLSLTEVTVVMILGTMIMAGLVGFYLASQGLWLDASTQVITQREASLVASAVRDSVRNAGWARATSVPDSLHEQLALYKGRTDPVPYYYFWWSGGDSLVHAGPSVGGAGSGPMVLSRADRFQFSTSAASGPVAVRMDLRLRTANGATVEVGTFATCRN